MRRALLAVVAAVLLAAPAAAQGTVQVQALPAFDQTRFYDQAAFERAIAPYAAAIARNANDARAHYWLGVAYLHMARLHRFGLAPYAADFGRRAVVSLERALSLQPAPEVMLALLDAYTMVGAVEKYRALAARLAALARPVAVR
ncbi:MAG TPA: tetratricopeptide repeat protein [bacterium]|nr:tetratricopeptide repeat protein [bacterium]